MKNHEEFLLVDISNTFTKIARASRDRVGVMRKLETARLIVGSTRRILLDARAARTVISSVVPTATKALLRVLSGEILHVGPRAAGGLKIDYPEPNKIGADRLANAVACLEHFGCPSIVVDFGTAVTFDVISARGAYMGGVIAPGLNLMADYLHSRTALLPHIKLSAPLRVVGQTTREAMLSGAVHGYRGLVKEILSRVKEEAFPGRKVVVVATGGDASLIGDSLRLFDHVEPRLTLEGLRLIAVRHFP